jgi:lysozyme family protein
LTGEPVTCEYRDLWKTCEIRPKHVREVDQLVDRIVVNKKRYKKAGNARGVPWHVVGVTHMLEGSGNFDTHLHNGDPLTARTSNIPGGTAEDGKAPVHVGGKRRRSARVRRPEPLDELVGAGDALHARAVQRLRLQETRHRHLQPYL